MSAQLVDQLPHPLQGGVAAIEDALDRMRVEAWTGLEPGVVRELAERLLRIEARVRAQQLAATRALEASGLAKQVGATSTGAMLARSFGGDRRAGEAMVHQAKALEGAPATEQALAGGRIGAKQAEVIAGAIKELPDDTTAEQKQACEDTLIGDAARYSLPDLRSRSKRITDQFRPEAEVDAAENDSLEAREKRAWSKSQFWPVPTATAPPPADSPCPTPRPTCSPPRSRLSLRPGATTCATTPEPSQTVDRTAGRRRRSTTATSTTAPASAWGSPRSAPGCPDTCCPAARGSAPP
ncbi:DUF222 domain-containing protein [Aeromicrobium yanjiei]|uniref:DUF222 domain-containing protein n=1 Tax=Aeromicrobium yanjiei TaxID=2662028 RepID=UPI002E2713AA